MDHCSDVEQDLIRALSTRHTQEARDGADPTVLNMGNLPELNVAFAEAMAPLYEKYAGNLAAFEDQEESGAQGALGLEADRQREEEDVGSPLSLSGCGSPRELQEQRQANKTAMPSAAPKLDS